LNGDNSAGVKILGKVSTGELGLDESAVKKNSLGDSELGLNVRIVDNNSLGDNNLRLSDSGFGSDELSLDGNIFNNFFNSVLGNIFDL
jgi:hypothetical protein